MRKLSGYLMTHGHYQIHAADEKWYSPRMPLNTVVIQQTANIFAAESARFIISLVLLDRIITSFFTPLGNRQHSHTIVLDVYCHIWEYTVCIATYYT